MLTTEQLLNGLPPAETLRFFATFARFEFAMKQCGYLRRTDHNSPAEASRVKLGERLPANFFDHIRDRQMAPTLVVRPPKNLMVRNAQLEFGDQPTGITNTAELLDAVWRVRNNLFHGNKMYPADRVRDAALMNDALSVIDAVLQYEPDLSSAFHNPQ